MGETHMGRAWAGRMGANLWVRRPIEAGQAESGVK